MATPLLSLSEEDASWKQWDENVETDWPTVAAPSPLPIVKVPAPVEREPMVELTGQDRRGRTDARCKSQRQPSKL
ncbi:hypothetical protein Forpe1208_v008780 [Fusarium oxysporum f. sp. rapae]|uniref:Uncharacterized protein n=1 Tax=Fusarium oxysporum f. sp. rapae TaxID=485398 RepID=A0A8J5P150_FUSOX|nr:hypothetical protein Forpe1208_v008780 [Fusarium oxysporum f. sp. rapae]